MTRHEAPLTEAEVRAFTVRIDGGDLDLPTLRRLIATTEALRQSLRWALRHGIGEIATFRADPEGETPDHACGYVHGPDPAICTYHEGYWTARELAGLLPGPDADPEPEPDGPQGEVGR